MNKIFFTICMLMMIVNCSKAASLPTSTIAYQGDRITTLNKQNIITNGLSTPESVLEYNNAIYVANIGQTPSASEDGYISRYENNIQKKLFLGKLNDPKGFVIYKDKIIISDQPRVKILNLKTEQVIDSVKVPNAQFLNDVVQLSPYVYAISDTGTGMIHIITLNNNFTIKNISPLRGYQENGINGLAYDSQKNRLFVAISTFGGDDTRGFIEELTLTKDFKIFAATRWNNTPLGSGALDGLAYIPGKDMLIVSDWGDTATDYNSSIYIFDTESHLLLYRINGKINSAADISVFNKDSAYFLLIPEFYKNTVSLINISYLL